MASGGKTQYAVFGAPIICDKGTKTPNIQLPPGHGTYVVTKGLLVDSDNKWITNIPSFGYCEILKAECAYTPSDKWDGAKTDYLLNGEPVVRYASILTCGKGGTIKFVKSGQVEK